MNVCGSANPLEDLLAEGGPKLSSQCGNLCGTTLACCAVANGMHFDRIRVAPQAELFASLPPHAKNRVR